MKYLALIGSTASGKSALALQLAQKHNAVILSIDSLSIYREIDIASAKPSVDELALVPHFGINVLSPDENASVFTFIDEYYRARAYAQENDQNLLIIGGSSFYLKSMIEGLSDVPVITDTIRREASEMLMSPEAAYKFLEGIDPLSVAKISPTDRYRLEKLLHLYLQTHIPPSKWFASHPPKPVLESCVVLNLQVERDRLRERIRERTQIMVRSGLIDEVSRLEHTYGREPNSMKAIGMIEALEFLDGKIDKRTMTQSISTHTAQLAKRQQTFNAHQFTRIQSGDADTLHQIADEILS